MGLVVVGRVGKLTLWTSLEYCSFSACFSYQNYEIDMSLDVGLGVLMWSIHSYSKIEKKKKYISHGHEF